jgi:predicted acylesterase/phospholipase RssA
MLFSMLTWRSRAYTMRAIRRLLFALGVTRKMTLGDVHAATGWELRVLVASLRTRTTHVAARTARVLDAVVASCSIPGFLNTGALVDGGTFGGFCDAPVAKPGPESLVVLIRCVKLYSPAAHPALRLVASYRVLMHKLSRRWARAAQDSGATVVRVPHGCALSASAERMRATYAASRAYVEAIARRTPRTLAMPV